MSQSHPEITSLLKEYLSPDIPNRILEKIKEHTEWLSYEANEIVYREKDESTRLLIVHSGQIDVQYLMPNGRRETVDTCLESDFLIWSALVEPYRTNSSGICRAKAEILAIDGAKMRELCESEPEFGYLMMKRIAGVIRRRLQAARAEIVDLRD